MNLALEVLSLAEDVLRDEARKAKHEFWSEHLTDVADRLADVLDTMDPDGNG